MKENINKVVIEVIASAVATGLIVGFGLVFKLLSLETWIAIGTTFFVTAVSFLLFLRTRPSFGFLEELSIKGLWRNEQHFAKDKGLGFTDYCRKFVNDIPDGQKVRILGYDWVELFSDTTVMDKHIFGVDSTSRLNFEVILMDADSPMALEKRAWEMNWKIGSDKHLYPEGRSGDSLQRLRSKIQNCTTVAKIFAEERPQFFKLKLTPTTLHFSILMSSSKAIGVIYNPPWKGKDSLIFEAFRPKENTRLTSGKLIEQHYLSDFYGFIEGYFDAIWDDPNWRTIEVAEKSEI